MKNKKSLLGIEKGFLIFLERAMGLEPTTAAMARRYSSQLSYAREDTGTRGIL